MNGIGIDGCKAGWFYVRISNNSVNYGIAERLNELVIQSPGYKKIYIDIPIGLRDNDAKPRKCDTEARKALGRGRSSSVFPAPLRAVLGISSYQSALEMSRRLTGKGLSRQAFAIAPKIKEVDDFLQSCLTAEVTVREAHPEICFWALNGCCPMRYQKKTDDGFIERMNVLRAFVSNVDEIVKSALRDYPRRAVARDDIVDALVVGITATAKDEQIHTFPKDPETDEKGLPMEIVFWHQSHTVRSKALRLKPLGTHFYRSTAFITDL